MNHTDIIRALTKEDLVQLIGVIGKDGKLKSISSVLAYYNINTAHSACRRILTTKLDEWKIAIHSAGTAKCSYDVSKVNTAISESDCWSDMYKSLGLSMCNHNKKHILTFMRTHGIIAPTFDVKSTLQRGKVRYTFESIFCIDSTYARTALRGAALRFNIKEYSCNKCGNTGQWQGEDITIELDHINGTSNDNRVENLRWLCPNCHSQTSTYRNSNNGSVA